MKLSKTVVMSVVAIIGCFSTFLQADTNKIKSIRAMMEHAPNLAFNVSEIIPKHTNSEWKMSTVSSVAAGNDGLLYVLHRSKDFDPVVVMNKDGDILRTWGKGLFTVPHSIRVDKAGNVWTVDSGSSKIYKFSNVGEQLLHIDVGEIPKVGRRRTKGTSDIAFSSDGHLFISDGYGNSRILEYSPDGKRLNQWGRAGARPGEFDLIHGIVVDKNDQVYVADRENGRIHKYTRDGKLLGLWEGLGKVYSLFNVGDVIWAGVFATIDGEALAFVIKLGKSTGAVESFVPVNSIHSITFTKTGDLVIGADRTKVFKYERKTSD